MINILYFFLPPILLLGIITSYTDIKKSRIRNKIIVLALIYALTINLFLIFTPYIGITPKYIIHSITNFLSALFVGFIMWNIGLWTAGDGKLFLAFATLTPIFIYNKASFIPLFPSINILINTFVPLFIFFFFDILIKTSLKQKKNSLKNIFKLINIIGLCISLFAFLWLIELLYLFIGIELNFFLTIFILFLILTSIEKLFSLKLSITIITISILRFIFDRSIYTFEFLKEFSFILILFIIIRLFILDLGFQKFTKKIKIKDLKPGMILAETIHKKKKKYEKRKFLYFSLFSYLKEKNSKTILDAKADGLTKKDIDKIKKISKKQGFRTIQIQHTLPFAPFIFFGTLLTILSHGNFLIFIKYILVNFI